MVNFEVVGLSGKAGSGKDYISQNFLIPLGYKQFSFAWHFKVWLIGKGEATHEEVFFTKPPHVRKLLQEEGTERGRNVYGENVWCNTAAEWMRVLAENCGLTKFVIPDVRFPNEVEFIQSIGGKVYRIVAPERSANNNLTEEARRHISETALDDFTGFNGYIFNDPYPPAPLSAQIHSLLNPT
jgi:hypothetical protein